MSKANENDESELDIELEELNAEIFQEDMDVSFYRDPDAPVVRFNIEH